jgi:heat shock protein HslJ
VRTRPLASLVLALGLSVVAGACGGDDDDGRARSGDAPAAPDQPAASLADRAFLSTAITEDGQARPLVDGTRISLQFVDGRLVAVAGCNTLQGQVAIEPDRLVLDQLEVTEMGCDPERHAQDDWLAGVLAAGPAYTLDGDSLRLESGTTVVELTDREVADPDRPLEGTVWRLDGLVDGDVASSVPAGSEANLVFADGDVSFDVVGCNQGRAPVTVDDGTLDVGELVTTRMACTGPAAELEGALVAVLDGEITFGVEADTLTLDHPSGRGLVFHPS